MIRNERRHFGTLIGLLAGGSMLAGTILLQQADAAATGRARISDLPRVLVPQQRSEDRGFALTLTSPLETYLVGWQLVEVEPKVPAGDLLEQADFFIDGRLAHTDRAAPYSFQADFSGEIRQHTIVVRARTVDGRQARVSFVSRSADIADDAAAPTEVIPAVVRDQHGRPVLGLTVSDFTVLEDGEQRPIVNFVSEPAPISIALALHVPGLSPEESAALLRSAAVLAENLPRHHSLAVFESTVAAPAATPREQARRAVFTFARDDYRERLRRARPVTEPAAASLDELLSEAAAALQARRGGRALVLLTTVAPSSLAPIPALEDDPAQLPVGPVTGPRLISIDALKAARATINVIYLGNEATSGLALTLHDAAEETGGEFIVASQQTACQGAFRRIAESFLHRYLISYQPAQPPGHGRRAIDIKVRRPGLEVRAPRAFSSQ